MFYNSLNPLRNIVVESTQMPPCYWIKRTLKRSAACAIDVCTECFLT